MTVPAPAGNAKKLIASRQMRGSNHDEGITMRLRLMLATSALLVACSGERTRAADAPPEPEKVVGEGVLAVLPMHVASRIPLIEVRVGTSEPLNFVVDTGFEVNVLDVDVARRLKLPLGSQTKEDAPGGAVATFQLPPQQLRLADRQVQNVSFTAIPVAGLGGLLGRPVAGILGHFFLTRLVVELDFRAERMRLLDPRAWQYRGAGQVLPVRIVDDQVLVDCELEMPGRKKLVAAYKLDTGSFDVAGLALNYVRKERVIGPGIQEVVCTGVGAGGKTEARRFRAQAFRIGPLSIERPVLGYVVEARGFENRPFAGTVSMSILRLGRLVLDYQRRRIILEPAASAKHTEDLSGLILVSPPPDFSKVVVAQVLPGSAADDAGLKAGDELLRIDDAEPRLESARGMFESAKPRKVRYRRDNQKGSVTLLPRPYPPR